MRYRLCLRLDADGNLIDLMSGELSSHDAQIFSDIIVGNDDYDQGLATIEREMLSHQEGLNQYGGLHSINYHTVFESLNDLWPYHGADAVFSGKLYLTGDDVMRIVPDEWGVSQHDSKGTYFFVEDIELVSLGIIDGSPERDDLNDEATDDCCPVTVAYGFYASDIDESDTAMFAVYPGETAAIHYPHPTLEAMDTRLHRTWPKEMMAVDKLIGLDERNYERLLKRLPKVAARIDKACKDSQEFTNWLTYYMHDRIGFDKDWPYAVVLQGEMAIRNDIEDSWVHITIEQPSLQYCRVVGIGLSVDRDNMSKTTVPSLILNLPGSADDPEEFEGTVVVPATSMVDLQSTRSTYSILEAALEGESHEFQDYRIGSNEVTHVEEDIHETTGKPLNEYDQLLSLELAIKQSIKEVMVVRRERFLSEEGAREASRRLCEMVNQHMTESSTGTEYMLKIDGTGVVSPYANIHTIRGELKIAIDTDNPVLTPPIGHDTYGRYLMMYADVEEIETEDERYYKPQPQMILSNRTIDVGLVNTGVPLVTVEIEKRVTARLDGTTDISIPRLDNLKTRRAAMGAIATKYRHDIVRNDLNKIDRAMYRESDDDWHELTTKYLRRVGARLESGEVEVEAALDALKGALGLRTVRLVGDVWSKGGLWESAYTDGIVSGIVMENPYSQKRAPALVVTSQGEPEGDLQYIPLESIQQFHF